MTTNYSLGQKIEPDFLVFCFKLLLLLIAISSDFNRCIIQGMNESHESRVTSLGHRSVLSSRLMPIITAPPDHERNRGYKIM